MRRTRTILWLILAAVAMAPAIARPQQSVVVYGDVNYPPYSFAVDGQPQGLYVDILRAVFARMTGYDVTIVMVPWKRGLQYVEEGEGIALFPPYYVAARTPWMALSEPILEEQVALFSTADNLEGRDEWPDDFFGAKIGLNSGYDVEAMGGAAFAAACESGKIKLLDSYTTEANLRKLAAGRIQFYLNVSSTDIAPYPRLVRGPIVNTSSSYVGFTRKGERFPFLADFRQQFDVVVKEMKAAKEIAAIAERAAAKLSAGRKPAAAGQATPAGPPPGSPSRP